MIDIGKNSQAQINKLEYLIAVRELLTDSQAGTIDLTLDSDSMAHFRPNA